MRVLTRILLDVAWSNERGFYNRGFRRIFSALTLRSMSVPPIEFTVDATRWEVLAHRLPSRHISVEIHAALMMMEVIQPSNYGSQRGHKFIWLENLLTAGDLRWIVVILTRLFQTRDGKSQT